jgi:high affinity Mn2+ porin
MLPGRSTYCLILALALASVEIAFAGESAPAPSGEEPAPKASFAPEDWSIHGQATVITQGHPDFNALYSGVNSLSAEGETKTSLTATLFLGRRLWRGGEFYFNPEITGGEGLSLTHGIAGFPNGEIYRVDTPTPKFNPARLFLRQVFALGDATSEAVEADDNELARLQPSRRITVLLGKFSLNDFFDNNQYAHDPRTQFMNWAFMDNMAWDYAADTRGYTVGFMLEYADPVFSIRWSEVLVPTIANGMTFDTDLKQAHGDNLEAEVRYHLGEHLGRARFLAYINHAHMGSYAETLATPVSPPEITSSAAYRAKYGFGLNLEQELTASLGVFARLGWNDGKEEAFIFTECDDTVSFGASLRGTSWSRAEDTLGLGLLVNGLSSVHAQYLADGGQGFLLGDGGLSYAPEEIVELYYLWRPESHFGISGDVQFVQDPGYNSDRGPTWVFAARGHYEF